MESAVNAVRPVVQTITKHLPASVEKAIKAQLGNECYHLLLLDFVPLSTPTCVKLATSKGLGNAIVGASAIVKVPQLVALLRTQSAAGVSFTSYALETISYIVTLAYNVRNKNPFSTYGESALIAVQNVAIAAAVLHFSGKTAASAVWVAGIAAAVAALFDERIVPWGGMNILQAGAGVLGVASKVPQIWTIYQEGGTGVLSAFTVFNFLLGSLTRIFTTIQEVKDPLILYGFVAAFALNAVLAGQMIYYWNTPTSKVTGHLDRKALKGQPSAVVADPDAVPGSTRAPRRKA